MAYDPHRTPGPPLPAWRGAASDPGATTGWPQAGRAVGGGPAPAAHPPAAPPSGAPPSGASPSGAPPSGARGRGDHTLAIVLAVAGVCVLVVAAGAVALRSIIAPPPGTGAAAAASPTPSASPSPSRSPSPSHSATATGGAKVHALPHFPGSGSPVTGRITDRKAHISYAAFGSPWPGHATPKSARKWHGYTDGQVLKLDGGLYDTLLSGPLLDSLAPDYRGTSSLHVTAITATNHMFAYFADAKRTNLATQPLHVRGPSGSHPGWLGAFKADYPHAKGGVRWAVAVVAVVDTGHKRPALLYGVVDSTHASARVDLNHWIASLRVV